MNPGSESTCASTRVLLDRYVDREMSPRDLAGVASHLSGCPDCAGRASRQTALRDRLRVAARGTALPTDLEGRIRQRLGAETGRAGRSLLRSGWPAMAIAAAVLLAVGLAHSWQNGGLRLTPGSQEAYIASISPEVTPVMRIGLQQHVRCAVFRKAPSQWPTVEEMAQSLGARYADLAPAMERHLPAGFRIAEAHVCNYQGRYYTHLAATDGKQLMSLLITDRAQGQAFENDLRAVAAEAGAPVYTSGVQRFRIAAFETRDHFVYLISDLAAGENLATLKSMLPEVGQAIRRLET
ncbi:MAG: zf-HC2 domain-containing protein [Acidobacteriota bacterium]